MAIDRKMDEMRDRTKSTMDDMGTDRRQKRAANARRVLSASTLAGDRVRNSAGEDLGKIEELMIDLPSGRIAYAVLSFGGFLGMGNKLFAIPWEALKVDEVEHEMVLNVSKETLEHAPGFDKDNWPDMADPNFGSQIYGHYGYKPFWEEGESTITSDTRRNKTLSGGGM